MALNRISHVIDTQEFASFSVFFFYSKSTFQRMALNRISHVIDTQEFALPSSDYRPG